MKTSVRLCLLASFSILASVPARAQSPGGNPYADPRMQEIRMQLLRAMGGAMPNQAAAAAPAAPLAAQTEAELAAKIMALPQRPEHLKIEDRKDGFTANGAGYIDPEGSIMNYAIDMVSGLVTYVADIGQNTFRIKVTRAGTDAEPLLIGTAMRLGSGWQVDSVTGKRIAGQTLTVVPGAGYLVTRDTAAFLYRAGQNTANIAIPAGFVAARFQRGDVTGTGFMLVERDSSEESQENKLFNSFKSLGSSLGINKKEDYAMLNIKTGEMIPLNISDSGKAVGNYSQCRRRNAFINECDRVEFRESLYDKTGRNLTHYYWRINWFNTPTAPILVAQENGLKEITLRDLKTGKKTIAFSRALGIAGYDSVQDDAGKVHISAQMGFSTEKIDDAVAFLNTVQEPVASISSPAQ